VSFVKVDCSADGGNPPRRPHTVRNPAIQSNPLVTRAYSPNGHLADPAIARSNSVADTTSFAYDGLDRLSTTTWPDSSTETLSYDVDSNATKRETRKSDSISFAYDTLNRLCTKTYAATAVSYGGTSGNYLISYSYDLAGRLIATSDDAASITAVATSASYAETMSYDALNHLVGAHWAHAPAQTLPTATSATFNYQYDATNRRIGQTATDKSLWNYPTTASSISYTANNLDQYTAVGSASPTYDVNGNLTNDGTYSYCYNTESRLTKILSAGTCASPTTIVASYAYDAQGRRKSKTVASSTTTYVTDADNREVLEYDGSSGVVNGWYAYAAGPNDVLNRMNVAGSSRQTLIPDIQGSIVATLDASTGARNKTGYQPFGQNPSLSSGSLQYTATRFDPESGYYYMRTRLYRTDWGQFTQPDVIGYAAGTISTHTSGTTRSTTLIHSVSSQLGFRSICRTTCHPRDVWLSRLGRVASRPIRMEPIGFQQLRRRRLFSIAMPTKPSWREGSPRRRAGRLEQQVL
jgi:RHS repeat-associated protein